MGAQSGSSEDSRPTERKRKVPSKTPDATVGSASSLDSNNAENECIFVRFAVAVWLILGVMLGSVLAILLLWVITPPAEVFNPPPNGRLRQQRITTASGVPGVE